MLLTFLPNINKSITFTYPDEHPAPLVQIVSYSQMLSCLAVPTLGSPQNGDEVTKVNTDPLQLYRVFHFCMIIARTSLKVKEAFGEGLPLKERSIVSEYVE